MQKSNRDNQQQEHSPQVEAFAGTFFPVLQKGTLKFLEDPKFEDCFGAVYGDHPLIQLPKDDKPDPIGENVIKTQYQDLRQKFENFKRGAEFINKQNALGITSEEAIQAFKKDYESFVEQKKKLYLSSEHMQYFQYILDFYENKSSPLKTLKEMEEQFYKLPKEDQGLILMQTEALALPALLKPNYARILDYTKESEDQNLTYAPRIEAITTYVNFFREISVGIEKYDVKRVYDTLNRQYAEKPSAKEKGFLDIVDDMKKEFKEHQYIGPMFTETDRRNNKIESPPTDVYNPFEAIKDAGKKYRSVKSTLGRGFFAVIIGGLIALISGILDFSGRINNFLLNGMGVCLSLITKSAALGLEKLGTLTYALGKKVTLKGQELWSDGNTGKKIGGGCLMFLAAIIMLFSVLCGVSSKAFNLLGDTLRNCCAFIGAVGLLPGSLITPEVWKNTLGTLSRTCTSFILIFTQSIDELGKKIEAIGKDPTLFPSNPNISRVLQGFGIIVSAIGEILSGAVAGIRLMLVGKFDLGKELIIESGIDIKGKFTTLKGLIAPSEPGRNSLLIDDDSTILLEDLSTTDKRVTIEDKVREKSRYSIDIPQTIDKSVHHDNPWLDKVRETSESKGIKK